MGLVTSSFHRFAADLLAQQNAKDSPLVVVGHPVGGLPRERASSLITDEVVDQVARALTREAP
ncbi:MAG: hypothetical protein IT371_05260 [Deltaproteobacteria bacterium]|nr:hypothetical protein [Deltaproteobacteria bacterium]